MKLPFPADTIPSTFGHNFLSAWAQFSLGSYTISSRLGHNFLSVHTKFPLGSNKNFFSGLEIYFRGLEIDFSGLEIYFKGLEIVLSQAMKDFTSGDEEFEETRIKN